MILTISHFEKINKKTFQYWQLIIIYVIYYAINNNTYKKFCNLNIAKIKSKNE